MSTRLLTRLSATIASTAALACLAAACVSTGSGAVILGADARTSADTTVRSPGAESGAATADTTNTAGNSGTTGSQTEPLNSTLNSSAPAATVEASRRADADLPVVQDIVSFGSDKTSRSYDGFLTAALQDIEDWWAAEYPTVYGQSWTPLKGGIYAAYPQRVEQIPGCSQRTTRYRDVEGNAFYCSDGDFIVYDDDELLPDLVNDLGAAAAGVVFAHEFGHAVQERAGESNESTLLREQQADCFAGAWTARAESGAIAAFQYTEQDVKNGLVAMIRVADPVQLSGTTSGDAHGTGFDRVTAFQDGYVGGLARCKTFFTEDRTSKMIEIPFRFDSTGGNLPLESTDGNDFTTLIPPNLDAYWTAQLKSVGVAFNTPKFVTFDSSDPPSCEGVESSKIVGHIRWCSSTNEVLVDADFANRLISGIGDMSLGYFVGEAYTEAAQTAMDSALTGELRRLADDCLLGAWTKSIVPSSDTASANPTGNRPSTQTTTPSAGSSSESGLELAAGDLDEAVITAIQISDSSASTKSVGTAFEKIAAFREGLQNGFTACYTTLSK